MSAITEREVVAHQAPGATYPSTPPFHPHEHYTEYAFGAVSAERNDVYEGVRQCFRLAGLDASRFGRSDWNPLRALIQPGETVLLKPNFVNHVHPRDPLGWRYVVTHGSVIRAVADFVWKALGGRGRVVVADAPETYASFADIVRVTGAAALQAYYGERGLSLELIDLRQEEWVERDGVVVHRRAIAGDPRGAVPFDLGRRSEFAGHNGAGRYYGADYDSTSVNHHHSGGRHEYLIAASAIEADVVFSLPKMKTHRKAGITCSLKNLVGVNADKNWLPHHTEGYPSDGGDEHPKPGLRHRVERSLLPSVRRLSTGVPVLGPWIHRYARRAGSRVFGDTEKVVRGGNWWGNDTIWRMCLDLNKIVMYGQADGSLRADVPASRKRHYVLVDGIIAGQGGGPVNPDPVAAGLLLFGLHPASTDAAAACLMGFDPGSIPIVRQAFRCRHHALAAWDWPDVSLVSNRDDWNRPLAALPETASYRFTPHHGWAGRIERRAADGAMERRPSPATRGL